AIVGGGIGGLTAAHALRMRGLNVTVFEQANEPREVGAGISIQPNATLLLERMGFTDRFKAIGTPIAGWLMRTSVGEPIDISALPASSVQSFNVHRAEFLKLLADLQPQGTLQLGHRLSQARETSDCVQLTFANGATVEADLAIGADGMRSFLEQQVGLETNPSSEGVQAYRFLIPIRHLP